MWSWVLAAVPAIVPLAAAAGAEGCACDKAHCQYFLRSIRYLVAAAIAPAALGAEVYSDDTTHYQLPLPLCWPSSRGLLAKLQQQQQQQQGRLPRRQQQ
jgi:hypothetical protein